MKRFVYLFQVERDLPEHLADVEGPDSDVRFLSYRAKSADPRSIFYPWSSWTQGRNRLLRQVVGGDWLYYVFGDADVRLEFTARGAENRARRQIPWRAFEEFLLEHEPAVGTPAYSWHLSSRWDLTQEAQTLRFFDPVLNAFHREALLTLLPYYDLLDEECADYSGSIVCSIAADLFPGHVLQANRVRVLNPYSLRGYTERLMTKPETLYLASLRNPRDGDHYLRQPEWSQLPHPGMGAPRRKAASYHRTATELATRYRLDHPIWARKRELLELPQGHEFFSDDPATDRARRWRERNPGSAPRPTGFFAELRLRSHALRERLGLVRTSKAFVLLRRIQQVRPWLRTRASRLRQRLRRPNARTLWSVWRASGRALSAFPTGGPDALDLIGYALDRLDDSQVVFVDVGTGSGESLGRLQDGVTQRKPVISIGVDPVQTRGFTWYTGFVLGAIADGSMTLAAILRQYGLAGRVLHWVRINHENPGAVFDSLEQQTSACLFLTVRCLPRASASTAAGVAAWPTVRAKLEVGGFRVLSTATDDAGIRIEATLVNEALGRTLLPSLVP